MIVNIDLEVGMPLYVQIADGVRKAIVEGSVQPGDRLPSGRDLADALGVNLETVQRSYRSLAEEGVVTTRVGRGTRVRPHVDVRRLGVESLIEELVSKAGRLGVPLEELTSMVALRYRDGTREESGGVGSSA